jgi:hypothetical protein
MTLTNIRGFFFQIKKNWYGVSPNGMSPKRFCCHLLQYQGNILILLEQMDVLLFFYGWLKNLGG